MRGDIVLSGFVLTADEWESLDPMARAQLLRAGLRHDDGWSSRALPAIPPPPPRRREAEDPYDAYELLAPG